MTKLKTDVVKGGGSNGAQAGKPGQPAKAPFGNGGFTRREALDLGLKAAAGGTGAVIFGKFFMGCKKGDKDEADAGTVHLEGCEYDPISYSFTLLGVGDKQVLGPVGNLMVCVDTAYHATDPKATVKFQNILEQDIYSDGDSADSAVEYTFDANNRQLVVSAVTEEGVVPQSITFCGIENGMAIFETDYVHGFYQCDHEVQLGTNVNPATAVNENVNQTLSVRTKGISFEPYDAYYNTLCGDLSVDKVIIWQRAGFTVPLNVGVVPEELLSFLQFAEIVDNQEQKRTFLVESMTNTSMRVVEPIETVELTMNVYHDVADTGLSIAVEMVDGSLDFDALYNGDGNDATVSNFGDHTHIKQVSTPAGTFRIKFEDPVGDTVKVSVYKSTACRTLENNGSFTVGEVTYDVTLDINGFAATMDAGIDAGTDTDSGVDEPGITSVTLTNPNVAQE